MRNRILLGLSAAIVAALLYFFLRPSTGPCDTPNHPLCIHVTVALTGPGGTPEIQPIEDRKVEAAAKIFWKIDTAGYTFTDRGIDFVNPGTQKTEPPAPADEFVDCRVEPASNGTLYSCRGTYRTKNKKFPYKVTVKAPTAGVVWLDPYIVNGN
jgi:hypothetical protein